MAKRTKRTRKDPCAKERAALEAIDEQIAEVLAELAEPDIPPILKKKLLARLIVLQLRRRRALAALEKCEMSHARRGSK